MEESKCFCENAIALGDEPTTEEIDDLAPNLLFSRVVELDVLKNDVGLSPEEGAELQALKEQRLCSADCRISIDGLLGLMGGDDPAEIVPAYCILRKGEEEPEESLDISPEANQ